MSNNVLAIGSIRPLKNRFYSDVSFFVRWSSPITFILIKLKLSSVSYHTRQKLNKLYNITKLKFTVAYLLPYRILYFPYHQNHIGKPWYVLIVGFYYLTHIYIIQNFGYFSKSFFIFFCSLYSSVVTIYSLM